MPQNVVFLSVARIIDYFFLLSSFLVFVCMHVCLICIFFFTFFSNGQPEGGFCITSVIEIIIIF